MVGDSSAVNYEAVAAQDPDVILALYAGLTDQDYETLSRIAPTVAQPGEHLDYGIPWQELTRTVGAVVGQAERAGELVRAVETRFAEVRAEHPEFVGATAVVATPLDGPFVYGPDIGSSRVLAALGFQIPPQIAELTGEEFGANVSLERIDLLDVDAIVWLDVVQGEGPVAQPLYTRLPVHTEGREIFLDSSGALGGASFISVRKPLLARPARAHARRRRRRRPLHARARRAMTTRAMTTRGKEHTMPLLVPGIDASTRRQILTGLAALGLIAAGGGAASAAEEEPGRKTVRDAYGDVEVPVGPRRVVAMDATTFGTLLALRFPPHRIAGVAFGASGAQAHAYLDAFADLARFPNVGELFEPNLEKIAAADPDLILLLAIPGEDVWRDLHDMIGKLGVPVFAVFNGYTTLDEYMRLLTDTARAVGLEEVTAQREAALRARVEAAAALLPEPAPSVAALRVFSAAEIYSQAFPFFDEIGLARTTPPFPEFGEQLSPEQLGMADADLIWVSGAVGPEAALATLKRNPLWASLRAVRNGHVRLVDDTPWGSQYSLPALEIILDEIIAGLTAFTEAPRPESHTL
ncbi:MAG: ABC transporter substrate-binding protein [Egibacteraceae bacterium]